MLSFVQLDKSIICSLYREKRRSQTDFSTICD